MSDVRIDQVWESNDPRDKGRRVKVEDLSHSSVGKQVHVFNVDTGRRSTILAKRFASNGRNGFTLVTDEQGRPSAPHGTVYNDDVVWCDYQGGVHVPTLDPYSEGRTCPGTHFQMLVSETMEVTL